MDLASDVALDHAPAQVFAELDRLDTYPAWMRLVHSVEPLGDDEAGRPAWMVQLRARVGPFTRSKRLRMVRTIWEPDRAIRYERVEVDDPDRAAWVLGVEIAPDGAGSVVTMHLHYSGDMWNSRLLNRILADEIDRGRAGLRDHLSRPPTSFRH